MANDNRISLVLGSGGARGLAHIGVIQALEEQGWQIASIAGAFAAFFAGRFVVALGAAALGVSGFSLSLTVLKGALVDNTGARRNHLEVIKGSLAPA